MALVEGFCSHTTSAALQNDSSFLPKQIIEIAHFFSTGLFAHSKLYHFLFTQPQAHDEQNIMLQVIVHLLLVRVCGSILGPAALHSRSPLPVPADGGQCACACEALHMSVCQHKLAC